MKRSIEYVVADPAGNITILVLTPADHRDYSYIAGRLLAECPQAEQVGYIVSMGSETELPFMEMCGLEFCGNASRAFAYYTAAHRETPPEEITVKVSGSEKPLHAWIAFPCAGRGAGVGTARIEMPVPFDLEPVEIPAGGAFASAVTGSLVRMEGIYHLVLTDIEAEDARFRYIREFMYGRFASAGEDVPAFGVMFMDRRTDTMAPVVYVRDVDTTYFEGSCASGSTAAAYALAMADIREGKTPGSYLFRQPAGELEVEVSQENGAVSRMILSGSMSFSDTFVTQLDVPED